MFARYRKYKRDMEVLAGLNRLALRGQPYPENYDKAEHQRLLVEFAAYKSSRQYKFIVKAQAIWEKIRFSRPVVCVMRVFVR